MKNFLARPQGGKSKTASVSNDERGKKRKSSSKSDKSKHTLVDDNKSGDPPAKMPKL